MIIKADRLRDLRIKLKHKHMCKAMDRDCTKEDINEYTDIFEALLMGEEALKELHRLNFLKESGRLIELPCAVGEEVWDIDSMCGKRPVSHKIETLIYALFVKNLFGHRFFLTKEEAEAKLKELEGDKE